MHAYTKHKTSLAKGGGSGLKEKDLGFDIGFEGGWTKGKRHTAPGGFNKSKMPKKLPKKGST